MKKNLVLTGMMGSGKSTIGKHLSGKLKMHYADIDDIIEKKLSNSISEIFEKKGENYFREIETEESIKIIEKLNYVVALGGGAFMNNKIREIIKKNSVSVWLDVDINLIYKRTNDIKKRPLLKNMSLEDLNNLYKKREPIYSLADIKINCNSKNKNEIVDEIIKIYENR